MPSNQTGRAGERDSENFSSTHKNDWQDKKRIPRYYRINNDRTELVIIQGDITRTNVDAIVNAANEYMTGGGGIDGVIHRAAGSKFYDECVRHRQVTSGVRVPTGRSRILFSYNLSNMTHYIINTAGPVYNRHAREECARDLSSCYKTAMALANLYDLKSIAFPAISCGIFGYPVDDGAEEALCAADKHADELSKVTFVLWDDHIYDAWVKKAHELKFVRYDEPSSMKKDKPITADKSKNDGHHPLANNTFSSMKIVEPCSLNTTNTDADSIATTPAVLSDSSDTQQTDDDNKMDEKPALRKRDTTSVNMADVDSGQPTEQMDSERQLIDDTTKQDDNTTTEPPQHKCSELNDSN